MVPYLKKRNKVYLLIRNPKKIQKLDFIKVRVFFINTKKKPANYKLNLPKKTKVYYIFYVLLLKVADSKMFI